METLPAGEGAYRIPAERSSFVGRRHELAEVRRLLSQSRLVTLVGPGGVGKTRLALRAAADLRRSFPDGTAFADLATVREPALVVPLVAAALDVRDVSGRWLVAGLSDVVGDRAVLLVLDNCEHVSDACAVLVDALLRACPRLRVLATSRQPLAAEGESLMVVPPLPTPEAGTSADPLRYDSVQLLLARAQAAAPDLHLTGDDAAQLGELCRRLDGIPLAIEMAAVRLRTSSPADVVTRLDERFGLLRRAGGAIPERHRTLRATMEWSFDLLHEQERVLWRRAAVFAGAFALEAAEAVCADPELPAASILDTLTRLVEASLLDVVRDDGTPRFRMLETVRAFGRELLGTSGERQGLRRRHRDWCLRLVAASAAEFVGPGQVAAFDRLAAVHAELSAALEYCLTTPGEQEAGLRMASDLWLYWEARGHLSEGRRLVGALLAACPADSPERPRGLVVAGFLALGATDPAGAVPLLEEALAGAEAGDLLLPAAMATQFLGQASLFLGDLRRADRLFREAAARYLDVDARYSAFCLADVGVVALFAGSFEEATEAFHRSLEQSEGGDPWTRGHALWGLGLVRLFTGDLSEAAHLEREALRRIREVDDRSGVGRCVEALSWVAAAQQDVDHAARLMGAAEALWRSIPAEPPPPFAPYRERYAAQVRADLGERAWAARHAEGSALDRRQAVALALREAAPSAPAGQGRSAQARSGPAEHLTERQRQVAALVAEGLTDRQIAAKLVISPRTAESHVEQILARLGFRSRAEIAAWTAARESEQAGPMTGS